MNSAHCILLAVLSVSQAAGAAPGNPLTPAQESLRLAEESVARSPDNLEAHNRLARAWLRRADEVELVQCHRAAERAARQALSLDPGSLSARRLLIEALLGQRRHREALELAETLNREIPDDVEVYGYIVDAALALGRLRQAEKAAQWMLDLRPNHVEAHTRAARLRELFGDWEGAADFFNRAFVGLPPDRPEKRAATLVDLARLLRLQGQVGEAERVLEMAGKLLPDGPAVLLELACLRQAQGRSREAVELLRRRADVSPGPERWYRLGEALRRSGKDREARVAFQKFEELALPLRRLPHNENALLTLYWAGQPSHAAQALELAESRLGRRGDIPALDALAWALHANQRHGEASKIIGRVLAVGVRDPEILARAAAIRGEPSR